MKKEEAKALANDRVRVIMEYITLILEDTVKVSAKMKFNHAKINGQNMNTLDIYVPEKDFEKHINLGITTDHSDIIYKSFLDKVIEEILPSETIGATKFYSIRSNQGAFDGIDAMNDIGSNIKINMYGISNEVYEEYNEKYDKYVNSLKQKNITNKS